MHDAAKPSVRPPSPCPDLCPAVRRLHVLAWRPGGAMHHGWWRYLGLDAWEDDYRRHPGCRRALDALIVQRRGFPTTPLPAALSDEQRRMLALEPRLPALMVALGAVAARAPELLLLGDYRRQLATVLGDAGCDQLAALVPDGQGLAVSRPAERVVDWLRELGRLWLDQTLPGSLVWQALSICLPPPGGLIVTPPTGLALPMLFRLERLL